MRLLKTDILLHTIEKLKPQLIKCTPPEHLCIPLPKTVKLRACIHLTESEPIEPSEEFEPSPIPKPSHAFIYNVEKHGMAWV